MNRPLQLVKIYVTSVHRMSVMFYLQFHAHLYVNSLIKYNFNNNFWLLYITYWILIEFENRQVITDCCLVCISLITVSSYTMSHYTSVRNAGPKRVIIMYKQTGNKSQEGLAQQNNQNTGCHTDGKCLTL